MDQSTQCTEAAVRRAEALRARYSGALPALNRLEQPQRAQEFGSVDQWCGAALARSEQVYRDLAGDRPSALQAKRDLHQDLRRRLRTLLSRLEESTDEALAKMRPPSGFTCRTCPT